MVKKRSPVFEGAYKQFKAFQGENVKLGGTPTTCFRKFIKSVFYSNRIENKKYIKNINSAKIAYKGTITNDYYRLKNFMI